MKKNKDGSLTLYIQKDSPARTRIELAARARRPDLHGDAAVLAKAEPPSILRPEKARGSSRLKLAN